MFGGQTLGCIQARTVPVKNKLRNPRTRPSSGGTTQNGEESRKPGGSTRKACPVLFSGSEDALPRTCHLTEARSWRRIVTVSRYVSMMWWPDRLGAFAGAGQGTVVGDWEGARAGYWRNRNSFPVLAFFGVPAVAVSGWPSGLIRWPRHSRMRIQPSQGRGINLMGASRSGPRDRPASQMCP